MHDQHTKTNMNERIVAIEDDHKRKVVRRGLGKSTEGGCGTDNASIHRSYRSHRCKHQDGGGRKKELNDIHHPHPQISHARTTTPPPLTNYISLVLPESFSTILPEGPDGAIGLFCFVGLDFGR